MGYNLRRAHGVQKQRFAAVFGPLGIRPVTLTALGTIYDNPGITQAELGKKLNIKRANMVPVMAELEGRGLIVRRPSDNDRRAHLVALTPAGRSSPSSCSTCIAGSRTIWRSELGQRERDQLLQLLKRFRKLATEPELDDSED